MGHRLEHELIDDEIETRAWRDTEERREAEDQRSARRGVGAVQQVPFRRNLGLCYSDWG